MIKNQQFSYTIYFHHCFYCTYYGSAIQDRAESPKISNIFVLEKWLHLAKEFYNTKPGDKKIT